MFREVIPEPLSSGKSKEKIIAKALAHWLKENYKDCICYIKVTGFVYRDSVKRIAPDIDVLMFNADLLASYEIKLLRGRGQYHRRPRYALSFFSEKKIEREEFRELGEIDPSIYEGIGEAIFNLERSNKSYLVYPSLGARDIVIRALERVPIGLVLFDYDFSDKRYVFRIRKEAPLVEEGSETRILSRLARLKQAGWSYYDGGELHPRRDGLYYSEML